MAKTHPVKIQSLYYLTRETPGIKLPILIKLPKSPTKISINVKRLAQVVIMTL